MEKDGLFLDCSEQGGKSTHTPGARGQGKMNEGFPRSSWAYFRGEKREWSVCEMML
jgi:hypothetical protein